MVCAAMAGVALVLSGAWAAVAVLGGGALIGISFGALDSGTTALAAFVAGGLTRAEKKRLAVRGLVRVVLRFALLAFLAYVMIARLRLHPVGLIAGASSVAAAAFVEAARFLLNGSKRST